ncbi:YppE family protein [Bacillus sp. REN3]|uniref:YppE family protein n=1 Tax=Bacillus sp. REN3 TaxID=2802440 RepID=UPI001AED553F|nr:YppE family protein [Bacillus sp. REN3]
MEEQLLTQLTKLLLDNLEYALDRYEKTRNEGIRGDFHTEVKPFADKVRETSVKWEALASQWIFENKPKNLYASQIGTAADYLEVISVQAFFPETSKKRFLDQIQSVQFTLKGLLLAIGNLD